MTVVLVCGGRDFDDYWAVEETLDLLADTLKIPPITRIVTGDAKGADSFAADWAGRRGKLLAIFEADWAKYGKSAGPRRNAEMLAVGKPDVVVAFKGGRGTQNMINQAIAAGVRVFKVTP